MTLAEELNELLPAKWVRTTPHTNYAWLDITPSSGFAVSVCQKTDGTYTVTMHTETGSATSNPVPRERLVSSVTHFTANVCVFARLVNYKMTVPVWAQEKFEKQYAPFDMDQVQ